MILIDEKKCLVSEAAAYTYYLKGMRGRKLKISNPSDLVLIRNYTVNTQKRLKQEIK